jgi:hypothetical protein
MQLCFNIVILYPMFTDLSTESGSKKEVLAVKVLMFAFIILTIVFGYFGYKYFVKSVNKEAGAPTITGTNAPKSISKNSPSDSGNLTLTEEQKNILPSFHTNPLPTAILNSEYKIAIFASVPFEGDLNLTSETLPEGLKLTNCQKEFNSKMADSIPNTLTTCSLEGIPTKAGDFEIIITAIVPGAYASTFQRFPLTVLDRSGL